MIRVNILSFYVYQLLLLKLYFYQLLDAKTQYLYTKMKAGVKNEIFDIDCVFQGFCGKGAIYISNLSAAKNKQLLDKLQIRAVISIAENGYIPERASSSSYLFIPASDCSQYAIDQHFDKTYLFLQEHRKKSNVLVHCMAGKSRSASIVAAYLMRKYSYSSNVVLTMLKRKRAKINPNRGFIEQLNNYADKLGLQKGQKKVNHFTYYSQVKISTKKSLYSDLTTTSSQQLKDDYQQKKSYSLNKRNQQKSTRLWSKKDIGGQITRSQQKNSQKCYQKSIDIDKRNKQLKQSLSRKNRDYLKLYQANKKQRNQIELTSLESSQSSTLSNNRVSNMTPWIFFKQNKSLQMQ